MEDKLQQKLFDKYPTIFLNKDASPQQSCMHFGIECGGGWYELIDKLCNQLVSLNNTIVADQVKEKFGGLRFYAHFTADELERKNAKMWKLIDNAENESYTICEECGNAGRLSTSGSWLRTLCDKHRKKFKYGIFEGII